MKIEIKNLCKSYGEDSILKQIHLEAEGVSAIGIIGESGCGKSTLLRQLSGIEQPDSGDIRINGLSPIANKREFQNHIGFVFQKDNLFPHLTIQKNITLILEKIKKMNHTEAEKITTSVLEKMHILSEADKLPGQVSGGQAQRASIARALATDPKLLFLDEPTASLDPVLTGEVLKAIDSLKNEGREFVFVTHEMNFLKSFADYIIYMKNGVIIEAGPRSCLDHPQTEELKKFLQISEV